MKIQKGGKKLDSTSYTFTHYKKSHTRYIISTPTQSQKMSAVSYQGAHPHAPSKALLTNGKSHVPSIATNTMTIGSKPSVIRREKMRFLVMDAPRQSNLHLYIKECRKQGVTDLVRVCEPTYNGEVDLANAGITLHEMAYPDGTSPPVEVIERWLDLVYQRFIRKSKSSDTLPTEPAPSSTVVSNNSIAPLPEKTIAVHCVAGLGRAPVLVAIALVEYNGMDPVDAVTFIRQHRRGAINEKQLNYLEKYRRKRSMSPEAGCCIIQ